MIAVQRRPDWRRMILLIGGLAVVASIPLTGIGREKGDGAGGRNPGWVAESREGTLPARLAAIDDAIARRDPGRAMREWRNAYRIALGSRRWDAMAVVGDAAARIDALARPAAGYSTGFRAEARQAYLRALLHARAAGSRDGIQRVSEAFAALGDREMSARALAMVGDR